jgi:hypothetical protein
VSLQAFDGSLGHHQPMARLLLIPGHVEVPAS